LESILAARDHVGGDAQRYTARRVQFDWLDQQGCPRTTTTNMLVIDLHRQAVEPSSIQCHLSLVTTIVVVSGDACNVGAIQGLPIIKVGDADWAGPFCVILVLG